MMRAIFITAVLWSVVSVGTVHAANPSLEDYYNQAPAVGMKTVAPTDEPAAPMAQEQAPPAAGSHVVTSVSKCFEDLGAEDAAEIKRNSLTPYADCQKRLRERSVERKAAAAAAATPVAETPRNYKRVVDDGADAPDAVGADSAKTAAPAKKK